MKDPAAFAEARLAEDEAAAKRAASIVGPVWVHDAGWSEAHQPYSLIRSPVGPIVADALGNFDDEEVGPFIARYDPARALREVEAGRRILERHRDCLPYGGGPCEHAGTIGDPPCPDLRDLLTRWAGHKDYREEWKP